MILDALSSIIDAIISFINTVVTAIFAVGAGVILGIFIAIIIGFSVLAIIKAKNKVKKE